MPGPESSAEMESHRPVGVVFFLVEIRASDRGLHRRRVGRFAIDGNSVVTATVG